MRLKHYVDPARMTLKYLLPYYEGIGRTHVKLNGRGDGPMLFGVPRWLYRKRTQSAANWLWNTVRGRRVESLTSRREYRFYTGMKRASRRTALSRETATNCRFVTVSSIWSVKSASCTTCDIRHGWLGRCCALAQKEFSCRTRTISVADLAPADC